MEHFSRTLSAHELQLVLSTDSEHYRNVVGYSGSSNQDSFYVGTPDFRLVTSPGATWQSVPPSFTNVSDPGPGAVPEPLTLLGAGVAAGLGSLFRKRFNQSQDKS